MLRRFIVLASVSLSLVTASAKNIRENILFGCKAGLVIPGPLSHGGTRFIGMDKEFFLGYSWHGSTSNWGIETDMGYAKTNYESKFDKEFSLSHRQAALEGDVMAFVKISERLRLKAGLIAYFPSYFMIMVEQKNNSTYNNYSNTDLLNGYSISKPQAGANLGIEYLIGKKQKWNLGLYVVQMGNGPVKSDRDFNALGIPVVISGNLKPMHFDLRIAFHFSAKKKDRTNQDD